MSTVVEIPFHATTITAMSDEGKTLVSLRHMCESIGVDFAGQFTKLKNKSWAVVVLNSTTGSDGKTYQMTMIDRRTMTMWLATIEPSRVKPEARPILEAFQNEAADALDAYFNEGGAINSRATEDQLNNLSVLTRNQMEVLAMARGLVDEKWLESKTRIVVAKALGELPQISPADMPLYSEGYLQEKAELTKDEAKRLRSAFGNRLSKKYLELTGSAPRKAPGEVGSRIRAINAYTEADRWIFDQVWEEFYADKYAVPMFQEAI